jgi:hypothetical protein
VTLTKPHENTWLRKRFNHLRAHDVSRLMRLCATLQSCAASATARLNVTTADTAETATPDSINVRVE